MRLRSLFPRSSKRLGDQSNAVHNSCYNSLTSCFSYFLKRIMFIWTRRFVVPLQNCRPRYVKVDLLSILVHWFTCCLVRKTLHYGRTMHFNWNTNTENYTIKEIGNRLFLFMTFPWYREFIFSIVLIYYNLFCFSHPLTFQFIILILTNISFISILMCGVTYAKIRYAKILCARASVCVTWLLCMKSRLILGK